MAETTIAVQEIVQAGITPTYAAANTDGSKWANTGTEYLEVVNADDDTPVVVTIAFNPDNKSTLDPSGLTVPDRIVSVPFGTKKKMGPFPPSQFSDSTNFAHVTFSTVTGITIGIFRERNNPG